MIALWLFPPAWPFLLIYYSLRQTKQDRLLEATERIADRIAPRSPTYVAVGASIKLIVFVLLTIIIVGALANG